MSHSFPDEVEEQQEGWVPPNWWTNPPRTVERALEILERRAIYLQANTDEGIALRSLLEWIEQQYGQTQDKVKELYPNAYFKPSYEQSLLLNCWWCGVDFPICFSANRIGKTACFVFNGILWLFPNNPDWICFERYDDEYNRPVRLLPRPNLDNILKLRLYLKEHSELAGDPELPYDDEVSGNKQKFATLQIRVPELLAPAWPEPPVTRGGTVWLGAPDNKWHRETVLKLWKRWLPAPSIQRWSETDLNFVISTQETGNPKPTVIEFSCKSYESEDTKWSGDAVLGIILTEGLEPDTLNEIKQRIVENGFLSWDYTPYEAANVGKKTALAERVYEKKEELPLQPHVFVGFSARLAPAHILPTSKKADLIRMWNGKPQGKARLDGLFFSTSPKILSKLDRPFHCLQWSKDDLFYKYPSGQLFRSIDPGYDHPTCCGWFLLSPQNTWFCYRFLTQSGLSIAERCEVIIRMSNNLQCKRYYGKRQEDFVLIECHHLAESEVFNATILDYHNFKIDETSGKPLQVRYINEGLAVIPSATIGDADRAQEIDKFLDKVPYYTHPVLGHTPSSRLFFLINEPGVDEALTAAEELYWERFKSGDRKGTPKDKVPEHGDDQLDVLGQIAASPYRWNPYKPKRQQPPDNSLREEKFATLQILQAESLNSVLVESDAPMVGRFGG